jgi:hypothetical protein
MWFRRVIFKILLKLKSSEVFLTYTVPSYILCVVCIVLGKFAKI